MDVCQEKISYETNGVFLRQKRDSLRKRMIKNVSFYTDKKATKKKLGNS